jgi:hypothetical protein
MMIAQRTLHLQLDEGRVVPVSIRKETTERSRHTGKELVQLHGWATAEEEGAHRAISGLLRSLAERPVRAQDETGEFAGRWCISWNAYAESNGVHTYTLLLREVEELSLEALLVEELEMRPYEYREMVVGDGLVIRAKMVGTEDDVARVREVVRSRPALRVVRRGIHDDPREMRLGVGEWSDSEDGIKYRLVLVDRELEGEISPELARIEEENDRVALAFYANYVERLSDLLVKKGLLSREELDRVREAAGQAPGVSRRDVWRVADVDEL